MKTVVTACTRDCPGACSIIAQEKDGRVVKLHGNPDHKITDGFLCKNTTKYLENFFYSPQRVLHPLIKRNGEWEQISWDEALDITASKIKKVIKNHGSQAILYYQGFGARTALQSMNKRFFNLLGGVTTTTGTVCGGIGHVALEQDYGVKIPHNPLDQLNSDLIIIWGRNPAVTDIHLWKILKKARRKGTKLVVIDPVKTRTAKQADSHLKPAPGTDHYLAMALIKIILKKGLEDKEFIENYTKNFTSYKGLLDKYSLEFLSKKCDVSVNELKELALSYALGKPSSIVAGWGAHRYRHGHLAFHMMNALAAICGNIGVSGGGVTQGFEEYEFFDQSVELDDPGKARKLSMPKIGRAILETCDPPVELIFVASGNPVNLNPNSLIVKKAFEGKFVVMIDHFLNDTSDVADLFLPATTFLEEENLIGSFGHSWISPINPVIPPQGEAKSEFEIFQLLSLRLGLGDEMAGTPTKWLKKMASPILDKGVTFEELQNGPVEMVPAHEIPYADKCFKTESGLFEFITDFKDDKLEGSDDGVIDENFPLHLLSTSPDKWVGSVLPESEIKNGYLEVQAHPLTLKATGVADGEVALLESLFGKLEVRVRGSEDVRCDFVLAYKGGLMRHNKNINVLTGDILSEKGEGAPYYDTRVRLRNLNS